MQPRRDCLHLFAPQPPQPERPPFVFLPGLDGTGELYARQAAALAPRFDVRCLHLPASDRRDWQALAQGVVAELRACQAASRHRAIHLCGESFGGCLALQVALQAPHLLERLILVNPATTCPDRSLLGYAAEVAPWLPRGVYRWAAQRLLPLLTAPQRVEPAQRRALLAAMQALPLETLRWRLLLLKRFQLSRDALRSLRVPSLLLAGGADRLLPSVREAQRLARELPEARVTVLPQSGHTCLLERDVDLGELLQAPPRAALAPPYSRAAP
jgi:pimeloyl-ACP methyl ester carboxylesterase